MTYEAKELGGKCEALVEHFPPVPCRILYIYMKGKFEHKYNLKTKPMRKNCLLG